MSWPTTPQSNASVQSAVAKAIKGLNDDSAAATVRAHAGFKLTHAGAPGQRKGYQIFVIAQRFDEAAPTDLVAFTSDDKFEEKPKVSAKKAAAKKTPAKKAVMKAAKKKAE